MSLLLSIAEVLKHPLFLLVAGAVMSSYVIPLWTRHWQNHQKGLEIKVALIEQISQIVTEFVLAIQFAVQGSSSQSQADLDRAYRDWEKQSSSIAARLYAYFPGTGYGDQWENFSRLLSDFYALAGIQDPTRRQALLEKLSRSPFIEAANIDWKALTTPGSDPEFVQNWDQVKQQILKAKSAISWSVLSTHMAMF